MTDEAWPRNVRTWGWSCRVTEVASDYLWAEVVSQPGTPGATVHARFDPSSFETRLYDGDVFTMTSNFTQSAPGAEEVRVDTVSLREVRAWTAEEIDAIRAEARARWADLQEFVEPATER